MKYGNKVIEILEIEINSDDFIVKLKYANRKIYTLNLNSIFSKPHGLAAEILRGQLFEKCFIESGALAWPNGFELCPDALLIKYNIKSNSKPNAA